MVIVPEMHVCLVSSRGVGGLQQSLLFENKWSLVDSALLYWEKKRERPQRQILHLPYFREVVMECSQLLWCDLNPSECCVETLVVYSTGYCVSHSLESL